MDVQLTKADKRKKVLCEILDLLMGAAFPFIVLVIFSSTIIAYGAGSDVAIRILALVGGYALIIGAYFIFGKQNGATAYRKYVLGEKKRTLGTEDKKALYKTGEYALWKGFVIGFITCVPFIIFEIINLSAPNSFTTVLLQYACGWAYFPAIFMGAPEAVSLVFIVVPVGLHAGGYYYGKERERKIQQAIAEESEKRNKKHKK